MRSRLLAALVVPTVVAGLGLIALSGVHAPTRAQQTEAVDLAPGCNNITLTWQNRTPTVELAAAVTPAAVLEAIWRFDNRTQRFVGFAPHFPDASDLRTVDRLDAVFMCLNAAATLIRPALPQTAATGAPGSGPPASHGGPLRDYVSLVDTLRARGATVVPVGDVSQPFFSVAGFAITVNGENVQVFEYPTEGAAAADAARVAPDGGSVGTTMITWVAPPHFYRQGRLIALYVGTNPDVTGLLTSVLGPQFAGR